MPPSARKDATRKKIEQMELERKERRKETIQRKEARKQEQLKNIAEVEARIGGAFPGQFGLSIFHRMATS
jgi:hypothetical protein